MKRLATIVFAVMLLVTSKSAMAQDVSPPSREESAELFNVISEFQLKQVDSVPDGITPIAVASLDDIRTKIKKINDELRFEQITVTDIDPDSVRFGSMDSISGDQGRATSSSGFVFASRTCSGSSGGATFNVTGDFQVGYSGTYRWISQVLGTRVYLTGATFALSLTDQYSYVTSLNNSSANFVGGGNVNVYLVAPNYGVLLYSVPAQLSCQYSVY
jgi:hypothetical protein